MGLVLTDEANEAKLLEHQKATGSSESLAPSALPFSKLTSGQQATSELLALGLLLLQPQFEWEAPIPFPTLELSVKMPAPTGTWVKKPVILFTGVF